MKRKSHCSRSARSTSGTPVTRVNKGVMAGAFSFESESLEMFQRLASSRTAAPSPGTTIFESSLFPHSPHDDT